MALNPWVVCVKCASAAVGKFSCCLNLVRGLFDSLAAGRIGCMGFTRSVVVMGSAMVVGRLDWTEHSIWVLEVVRGDAAHFGYLV